MRQYERNAVTVDQCVDCRGIFLDRGELERLVDAETQWARSTVTAAPPEPSAQAPKREDPRRPRERDDDDDDRRHRGKRRRKHWIEELFD